MPAASGLGNADFSSCSVRTYSGYDGSLYNTDPFNSIRVIQGDSFHSYMCPQGTFVAAVTGYEYKGAYFTFGFGASTPKPAGASNIKFICCPP